MSVDFTAIAARIAPYIRATPVLDIPDAGLGDIVLKLDLLQPTGSFKVRGAANTLTSHPLTKTGGVVAASGGNHGAAVAFVAQQMNVPCRIYSPAYASQTKIERMKHYGAHVELQPQFDDALKAAEYYVIETGALFVHPYNTKETIEGQGTCAYEFRRQTTFDTLLVGVGGGGLSAGSALALGPEQKLVCVETEGTNSLHLALAAGRPVHMMPTGISADSLGAQKIGDQCFEILKKAEPLSLLVSDDHVRTAQRFLWDHTRLIVEPGGATAFAALTSGIYKPAPGERVGVIVCGANTDPSKILTTP